MLRIIVTKTSDLLVKNTKNCPILGHVLSNPDSMQPALGRWGRGPGKTIEHYDNCFSTTIKVDKEHYDEMMKRIDNKQS